MYYMNLRTNEEWLAILDPKQITASVVTLAPAEFNTALNVILQELDYGQSP